MLRHRPKNFPHLGCFLTDRWRFLIFLILSKHLQVDGPSCLKQVFSLQGKSRWHSDRYYDFLCESDMIWKVPWFCNDESPCGILGFLEYRSLIKSITTKPVAWSESSKKNSNIKIHTKNPRLWNLRLFHLTLLFHLCGWHSQSGLDGFLLGHRLFHAGRPIPTVATVTAPALQLAGRCSGDAGEVALGQFHLFGEGTEPWRSVENDVGVDPKIGGKPTKMDGENNGKSY